ncbi:MAG: hypothetical protein AAFZ15_31755 [Bacteroidota bacterium]
MEIQLQNKKLLLSMILLKKIIIPFFLLWCSTNATCSELASWWQKTHNGTEICKEKWSNIYYIGIKCLGHKKRGEKFGHNITDLSKWYFYQNHIIGAFSQAEKPAYFIFNEFTCEKQIFLDKNKFDDRLNKLDLKPFIWTRWYDSNWGMILTNGDIGDSLILIFFKLPILFITGIIILIGFIRTKFDLKHKFNKISLAIIGLIILRLLMDIYPGSI